MAASTYIIFRLHGGLYGMPSMAVEEVFSLPELMPIAEAPPYIAGLLSVRGAITPIIDLDLRLGRAPHRPAVTDVVILFGVDGHRFGLIVDEVLEVRRIPVEDRSPVPEYGQAAEGQAGEIPARFISAIGRTADGMVALIDPPTLLRASDAVIELEESAPEAIEPEAIESEEEPRAEGIDGHPRFAPLATEEERGIFRARAEALARRPEEQVARRVGMALFRLGGETFAVEIGSVREFAVIDAVTPVPCTPPKIVGQMNLRGEILTLVDVRPVLSLPQAPLAPGATAIVIDAGDQRAGVVADNLFELIYPTPEEITPAPLATRSLTGDYVTGTLTMAGTVATVIDLAGMIDRGEFDVEEEVA